MRYGKFLKENGTIGFIAPSFGCTTEPYKSAFENALSKFKEMGYETAVGANAYKDDGIGISTDPRACGKEINEWYRDPSTDILISCGGGELMCEDLDYVDFEAMKKADPKWFMGYSDNTNLAFLLETICDTAAVYGPNAPAFGMEPWHESLKDAFDLLTGRSVSEAEQRFPHVTEGNYSLYEKESLKDEEHPLEPYNVTEEVIPKGYPGGDISFHGRLIGGCLDVLTVLLGTKYDRVREFGKKYKDDGMIWFFEACDLGPVGIRRAVWQMKAAGWFENTNGILVGRPYHNGETEFGLDQYHAVTDMTAHLGIPVIMDLDIGHVPPAMPVVLGSMAEAELSEGKFTLGMELRP